MESLRKITVILDDTGAHVRRCIASVARDDVGHPIDEEISFADALLHLEALAGVPVDDLPAIGRGEAPPAAMGPAGDTAREIEAIKRRLDAMGAPAGGGDAAALVGVLARLLSEDEVTVEIDGARTTLTMKDLAALAPDPQPEPEEGGA